MPHVKENIAAAAIALSDEQMERLDRVAPVGSSIGERYPAAMMGSLNG